MLTLFLNNALARDYSGVGESVLSRRWRKEEIGRYIVVGILDVITIHEQVKQLVWEGKVLVSISCYNCDIRYIHTGYCVTP
jgi:hypothetical protein